MARSTDSPTTAFGVSWWNRAQARDMADGPLEFVDTPDAVIRAAADGRDVLVWASREPPDLTEAVAFGGGKIVRVEDGFIRSPGLGAHFSPAYSLIFDRSGVYYDSTGSSDLETLLATHGFGDDLKARAAALRRRLVGLAVSKYAVGRGQAPERPAGRTTMLVVGQVEDDASIRLGGAEVRTNLELLEAARAAEPTAWIAYKPHPDVLFAGRPGDVAPNALAKLADAVWPDIPIASALDWADAVCTISSLAGFEALLRGKRAIVYGRPFYAGWGLTDDRAPQPARRGRALDIDALTAATLLLYPRYLDPYDRKRIQAEDLVDRFEAGWTDPLVGRPLWHRALAFGKRRLGPLRRRYRR